jgi:hypothetical protein
MALSAEDLSFIRSMLPVGNNVSTDSAYVSDTQLNYLYDNIAASSVNATIAWALKQMCIKSSNLVGRTNAATGDTVQSQQEREAICAAAQAWANIAGIPSGAVGMVTTGSINLGIDEEDSSFNIT